MNGEQDTMYYVHKDHLGSFDVITDKEGNAVERYSFDPWGRRRNPVDWTFNNVPAPRLFDRGYTGHEHLDIFSLINIACPDLSGNGRVYDPWLGRFLSPDPFVQTPTHGQSFNRYSYCLNNPLKYTDPSGYKRKPFYEWEAIPSGGFSYQFQRYDFSSLYIPGSMGYICIGNDVYIDKATGKTVDFNTVYNNYILPAQNKEAGNPESTDIVTLQFPRLTPVLTNWYTPGAIEWKMDDGTIIYVFGYTTIYTSKTYEVGAPVGGGETLASDDDKPLIPGIYKTSWENLVYQIRELDRAFNGRSNGGKVPAPLKFIANLNPLVSISSGVKTIMTGSDIYNQPVKGQYTQGTWMIITGTSNWFNISPISITIDQTVPLILDKTKAP